MPRPKDRTSRRRFLTAMVGAVAALVWQGEEMVKASRQDDVCYWDPGGAAYCEEGTRFEYWCYVCCIAGSCQIHYCE